MIEIKCKDVYNTDDDQNARLILDNTDEFILMSYPNEHDEIHYQLTLKATVHNNCLMVLLNKQEYERLKELKNANKSTNNN